MDLQYELRRKLFEKLWKNYYAQVPYAPQIEQYLASKSEPWIEDHVAFRSLPGEHCGSHILERLFTLFGYEIKDDYHFEEKKLNAFWMAPIGAKGAHEQVAPKIFISELIVDAFDSSTQAIVNKYTQSLSSNLIERAEKLAAEGSTDELVNLAAQYLTQLPAWMRPSYEDFSELQKASEYASWTLLYGAQINHFTLSVHTMKEFKDIGKLGELIEKELSIPMNHSGGLVKGSPEVKLEQISTMAVKRDYLFSDRLSSESYGFVEFALRHPLKQNAQFWEDFYQGFVTENANLIFESTFK